MNDEDVKAQAIQDPAQTQNLIAIERARGDVKLQLVTRLAVFAVVALALLLGTVVFVVHQAGKLELPWPRIGTALATLVGASGVTAVVARIRKRLLRRRQEAAANAGNQTASPADGDQNQVGTP
ncbi:hypothetical protein [Streptomyces sp. NPDC046859]|uniref:hypothetical protein n=1 Tax=Streptomyces sp. NPDC046859 TaxID=3155734 RepID=UPI003404DCD4